MVDDRDTTPSMRDILHQKRPHKFCPYCGFRNEGDVDICDQCGKDISWIRIPEHTPTVSAPKQKPKSPPKKERIFSNLTIILVILGILVLIALILVLTLTTGGGEGETPSRLGDVICQVGAPSGPAIRNSPGGGPISGFSGQSTQCLRRSNASVFMERGT